MRHAEYEAVLSGPTHEQRLRMGNLRKMVTVTAETRLQTDRPEEEEEEESENAWVTAWDDVSDQSLDANEVKKARAKEMGYIADKQV